jgi:hypothetical protein
MQATSNFHNQVGEAGFGVAKGVLDNATALDTGNDVLDLNPETSNDTIEKAIFGL